jgi:2-polyprenyl-3-methyl-5-hydroxy-6-metoxy-1,4-benzoquinol methylase
MSCPFCNDSHTISTSYPINIFNGKEFAYVRCKACRLAYLDNFPDESDYAAMYPPSYQRNGVENEIQPDPYVKLYGLRFSYGYQFDLIKKHVGAGARILDYGCGTGHFLANAVHYGFACDGAEFNPEYIKLLADNFKTSHFYTIQQVLSDNFTERYDVIRLSNVLEHLTAPREITRKLISYLKPGGILLVEGPIENNFSLAETFRKGYYRVDKWMHPKRTVSAPPYHIFFSDEKNQRQFFRDCGLEELDFNTGEEAWPFPASLSEAKGLKNKIMASVAKLSKAATGLFGKNWGNIFIYCGKIRP